MLDAPPPRLLVVEDDERIASSLRRGLQGAGFRVDVCIDGDRAIAQTQGLDLDLVVLDLLLPGQGGLEVLRAMRAAGRRTPVLVLTARDTDQAEVEAFRAGADGYLTKPFSFPVLVALVRRLLRESPAAEPLEVTGLRLDTVHHRCWRGETEVSLTPREFSLLEFLVRRTGRVATAREVLDGVWDGDYDGDPAIVEVYMGRLRRKIDEPFGAHDLEAVRGSGYRFCGP